MTIRSIPPSDLPALLRLYAQLHPADDALPHPSAVDAVWLQMQNQPGLTVLGNYRDDQLVATCTLVIIPNLTRGTRPYGLIENVVTDADHRGQGIGRQLLAHAKQQAWASHCYKVMLMTGRLDEPTLQFYQSAGFDRGAKQAFVAKPDLC